ncbi:MAG: PD-(D/E)XK motif protein [Christensenellaceae bacterium]
MLKEAIRSNWATDISGYAQIISCTKNTAYPAWTIKFIDSYGVALLYDGNDDINETFANARIYSEEIIFDNQDIRKALILTTSTAGIESTFSSLCFELIDPGPNGEKRAKLLESPVAWWKEWKEMLGNRNIDVKTYDVLGELCVLKVLIESGEEANWNGPDGASYDIETERQFIEVKSTVVRDRREVTISNPSQLDPPDKPLDLVLCQFEPTVCSGVTIDSVLQELTRIGYNTVLLNTKLSKLGFEEGMSSRKRTFILHGMLRYAVDSDFPRITPSSFVGGVMPVGITKFTYTVDLSGMTPKSMMQGADHDLQNN